MRSVGNHDAKRKTRKTGFDLFYRITNAKKIKNKRKKYRDETEIKEKSRDARG